MRTQCFILETAFILTLLTFHSAVTQVSYIGCYDTPDYDKMVLVTFHVNTSTVPDTIGSESVV